MKEMEFTTYEMSVFLKIKKNGVNKRIHKLGIKPLRKEGNVKYYSRDSYLAVINHNIMKPKKNLVYEPFRIETVYHIYESKMNDLTL